MQRKVVLTFIGFLVLAVTAFAAETGTEKISLKIEGMECGKCAQKIEAALMGVTGVKSAHVSLMKETADVEVTKDVTKTQLAEAVSKIGYSVAGQKDAPSGHKEGDCGKKCPMMGKHKDHPPS